MNIYEVTSPGGRTTHILAKNSTSAKRKALRHWGMSNEIVDVCSTKKIK